ncbi:hypothetical protein VTJ83DRAFT_255 [Remersonia thermophila]|uniref:Granulins domain-containing protein n=1 Tax=Remersonia thermophila TaxID=72144 RepID=A0ABR4DMY2_9PEZI
MHCSPMSLLVATTGVLVAAVPVAEGSQKPLASLPTVSNMTRHDLTCAEAYGAGWIQCGEVTSNKCYNPELGHSCCSVDNSYCLQGTWCAPVAGFCCLNSESLEACAKNAGFKVPGK